MEDATDPEIIEEDDDPTSLTPQERELKTLRADVVLYQYMVKSLEQQLKLALDDNDVLRCERILEDVQEGLISQLLAQNKALQADLQRAMSTPAPVQEPQGTITDVQRKYDQLLSKHDLAQKRLDRLEADAKLMQERFDAQDARCSAHTALLKALQAKMKVKEQQEAQLEAQLITAQIVFSLKEKVGDYVLGPPKTGEYQPRNLSIIRDWAMQEPSTKQRWIKLGLDANMFSPWAKLTQERSKPLHPKCIHGGLYVASKHADCKPTKDELLAAIKNCGFGEAHQEAAIAALEQLSVLNTILRPGEEDAKYCL